MKTLNNSVIESKIQNKIGQKISLKSILFLFPKYYNLKSLVLMRTILLQNK